MPLFFNVRNTTVTPDHSIYIPDATPFSAGLMSAADKVKLDSLVPGGGIGGTIAINEVAVGSGPDTIYGDARFLWNGATGVLSVNNAGSFFSVNTSTEILTVASTSSPAVTTIEPNITTISNGVGNVSLLAVGGSGAIGTTGAVPLDILLPNELRINGSFGAVGWVVTSQGAGLPPVWAPGGGGGGGVASVTASAPLASSGGLNPDISITAGTTPGDVLTWNGAAWASTAPAGTIGGSIAANEVAFGTGANTIGGDPLFTWNAGTGVFNLSNPLGQFVVIDTSTLTFQVLSPVSPDFTNLNPGSVAVDNGLGSAVSLLSSGPGSVPAISTYGSPLNLQTSGGELQINGAPGAAGQVLTSAGAGLPPVWAAGGGGGGVASVTASAPLASSGGANPDISITAGSAPGDVLTWNGAAWASTAPAGTIGGSIAANEVAFGTGVDTIGGDARITFNAGTGIFTVDDVGGVFFSVDPASGEVNVDSGVGLKTRLQPNNILLTNGTDDFFVETVAGVGTINALGAAGGTLNLALNELQVNAAPGAAGEVLTSQGAGLPPTWQPVAATGIGGSIAVNQIAYGSGANTIQGSANLTYDGSKATITGSGSVLELADSVDGVFFETNSTFYTVSLLDPLGSGARVDLSSVNGVIAQGSEVKLTKAQAPSTNRLISFGDDGTGKTALKTEITTDGGMTFSPDALRFQTADWDVNGNSGAAGEVLTSNGVGFTPTWTALPSAPVLTIGEIPSGLVNGANTVFTTAANFTANTTMVYVNGVRQLRGVGNDYTETGPNQITFAVAPLAGFQLQLDYYPV